MDESANEFSKRELKKIRKEEEKAKEKRSGSLKNLGILVAILAVIAGIGYGLMKLSDPNTSFAPPLALAVDNNIDNIKGNVDAPVTLVEYADYQCPGCGSYYPVVKELSKIMGDDLRVVYRHFPLVQHQNAEPAAYAAEAAKKQGKFWEMTDLLFTEQASWSDISDFRPVAEGYAKKLELNVEQFFKDYESQEVKDKVERDSQSGIDSQVSSTPTFYLNGKKIEKLPGSPQAFYDLIQKEIDRIKSEN